MLNYLILHMDDRMTLQRSLFHWKRKYDIGKNNRIQKIIFPFQQCFSTTLLKS